MEGNALEAGNEPPFFSLLVLSQGIRGQNVSRKLEVMKEFPPKFGLVMSFASVAPPLEFCRPCELRYVNVTDILPAYPPATAQGSLPLSREYPYFEARILDVGGDGWVFTWGGMFRLYTFTRDVTACLE